MGRGLTEMKKKNESVGLVSSQFPSSFQKLFINHREALGITLA
jgi:hypothetical protein